MSTLIRNFKNVIYMVIKIKDLRDPPAMRAYGG